MPSGGPGAPLPVRIKDHLEWTFRTSLDGVRVHTGQAASAAARVLSARAFTRGKDIYLGEGERETDLPLIAHEVAHTLQQRGAQRPLAFSSRGGDALEGEAQRASSAAVSGSQFSVQHQATTNGIQRWGLSDVLDFFAGRANALPGFRLLTIVLGTNPINQRSADRSAANILRALVELLPGGSLITQALDQYGVFERAGTWVEAQLRNVGVSGATLRQSLDRFLDSVGFSDILSPGSVWERARAIFSEPIDRLLAFGRTLVDGIVGFVKDAILRPLAVLASQTRGWDLLKAILGRDPITGDAVPRNAETLIGGFMHLIGQDEIWQNIQRGNAVARAWAWFQGALGELMGFVSQIPGLFMATLRALQITDIVVLPRAFARVASALGDFIGRFVSWAGNTIWNLLEIVFSVVAPNVMTYLNRARSAFRTILQDPIRFARNLMAAGVLGLRQFMRNFLTHLRTSLIGWLTGAMTGANIYIPQSFSFLEIIKFILSVLGLTWQNVRQKLVTAIGETAVAALETGFDIVVTLVREGPAAAWERIVESINNLREMVIGQVMNFVKENIITAAITRLLSMLSPIGAFIQAILGIYNTVMFFVERMQQIAQVAAAVIDSLSAIANGVIGAAADRVEQTMARLLTVVISFLARIAGLGRVTDVVINVINQVRQPIDRALTRVVEWIVAQARRLGRLVVGAARRGVSAIAGWLGIRQAFQTEDGEHHNLYFERRGSNTQLIRASSLPTELETFLNTLPASPERTTALGLARDIRTLTRTSGPSTSTTRADEAVVLQKVTALTRLLVRLAPNETAPNVPPVQWTFPQVGSASVTNLSSRDARNGQAAAGPSQEIDYANNVGESWVRMHLITHGIGGGGQPRNWVPAPVHINSGGPVRSFERAAEELVRSAAINAPGVRPQARRGPRPNVVWVNAIADQAEGVLANGQNLSFYRRVRLDMGIYRPEGSQWIKVNNALSTQTVRLPVPSRITLSTASGTQLNGPPFSVPRTLIRAIQAHKAACSDKPQLLAALTAAGFSDLSVLDGIPWD